MYQARTNSTIAASGTPLACRTKNFAAAAAAVGLASMPLAILPHYHKQLASRHGPEGFSFTGLEFWGLAVCVYVVLLAAYFFSQAEPGVSKPLQFWRVVRRFVGAPLTTIRQGLSPTDRLAVLSTLLKCFFGPQMALIMFRSMMGFVVDAQAIVASAGLGFTFLQLFNRYGFWMLLQLIILVDVAVFTAGYLIEMRRLKNEIRSVDPTLLGWAAAMACYWPFSSITGYVLGRSVSDFPQFDNPTMHITLNLALLVLMAVYTSASVALGFKASNLTHRGIVSRGPYAWVRHPAYICKNLAWWIGAVPVVSAAFASSLFEGASAVASVIGWSMLYVLRALTEEDHLRSVDGEYAAYASRVRYRFIPGVV